MLRKRKKPIAVLLFLLIASSVFAASHREAPLIANDPAADITDFYAFRSWQDPSKVVFVMNVIPLQDPSGGPNYFNFDDNVLYEIHIDNNKDNSADDIVYQFRFKTEIRSPGDVFPLSYVAVPPITALQGAGSQGLLLRQSYTVKRLQHQPGPDSTNLGQTTLYAVPSNVGPRTMPDYEGLAAQGIYSLSNGGRVFAGQRDDTFYIDLGGAFDTLNFLIGTPILSVSDDANDGANIGAARDLLSGFDVNTIAIEVPISEVMGPQGNRVIGAYASTSRPRVTVLKKDDNDNKYGYKDYGYKDKEDTKDFVQVARMGNPLVNELIIATVDKDRWNATDEDKEAQFLKYYCNPSLANAINLVYGTSFPTMNREDLVNALLRYSPGPAVCNLKPRPGAGFHEKLADLIRLDLNVSPTAAISQKRLGILAHDSSGNSTPDPAAWPNGRRPNDDVTDIALRVVAGALINPATPRLGDGVNFNSNAEGSNVTFNGISTQFPFLPKPHPGRDRRHVDPGETP